MRRGSSWLGLMLLVSACSIGNIGNGVQEQESETMPVLTGRIVDPAGAPLADVRVTGNGLQVVSNADGYWTMAATSLEELPAVVTYFRRGYAPHTVVRSRVDPVHHQLVLQPAAAMRRIEVAEGAVLRVDSNRDGNKDLTLNFPAGFLSDTEQIDVTVSMLNTESPDALRQFPGTFITRGPDSGSTRDLAYGFGAVNVSFHQGDVLLDSVALAEPVAMSVVLGEATRFDLHDGDVVDLAWLDRHSGEWVREQEGIVVVQNGILAIEAEVEHFTWWHFERGIHDPGCVTVALQSDGLHQTFAQQFELLLQGEDYFGAAPPVPFNETGQARTTGRHNHQVKLNYRYAGAGPQGKTFLDDLDSRIRLQERGNTFASEQDQICQTLVAPFDLKPGSISGFVQDAARRPVTATVVSIPELGLQTRPRPDGFYQFRQVPYSDNGVRLTLRAASTDNLRVVPVDLINTQVETRVDLVADTHPRAPWFVDHTLSNSTPLTTETVDFSFTVQDDAPGLSWSAVPTAGHIVDAGIEELDDGSVYQLTVYGSWRAEVTGSSQLLIQVRDATDQESEMVLDVEWRD